MLQDIPLHQNVKVKILPRAKKTEMVGTMSDGTHKIRLQAVPENGKANVALLAWLGEQFGGQWEIISGATHSKKVIRRVK